MARNERDKAIIKAIKEAAQEMTQAQASANDLIEGLEFLWEKSGQKFTFDEKPSNDGSVVLETNLRVVLERSSEPLSLTVSTKGEITSNMFFTPATGLTLEAGDAGIAALGMNDLEESAPTSTKPVPCRITAEEALAEIGQRVALQGYISSADLDESTADNTAKKAALDGIRVAEEEIALAERAAAEITAGLEALYEQSKGNINFTSKRVAGGSDVELKVFSLKGYQHFPPVYIQVSALNRITVGGNASYINGTRYDALEQPEAVTEILADIAKSAAFNGQIPLAAGETEIGDILLSAILKNDTGTADVVRDAVRAAVREQAQARAAATELIDGLETLYHRSRGRLVMEKKEPANGTIELAIKLKDPARLKITIDAEGTMAVGDGAKAYNAWRDADVAEVLADIAKKAVYQGFIDRPKARRPQGPARPA